MKMDDTKMVNQYFGTKFFLKNKNWIWT